MKALSRIEIEQLIRQAYPGCEIKWLLADGRNTLYFPVWSPLSWMVEKVEFRRMSLGPADPEPHLLLGWSVRTNRVFLKPLLKGREE